jgi:NAD-dependent dihydropyrimidine dehydrogenase PreA subunit
MIIHVSRELCTGCGACIAACTAGAIQWLDQQPVIDDTLCTRCQSCAEACPNQAITAILIPAQSTAMIALPESDFHAVPAQQSETRPSVAAPAHHLAPLAGTALAFLSHEVAPRLADLFIMVLEHRMAQPAASPTAPPSKGSQRHAAQGRGERRQTRYRGGRTT